MQHTDMTRDSFGTHSHMPSHTLLQYAPADISGESFLHRTRCGLFKSLALLAVRRANLELEFAPLY